MGSTNITQTLPTLHTLLGEALEVCIHQILYQRQLYPRDIFVATREYIGIRCYVANHEGLASYIVQTLDVAIPALCSGIADRLSLVILDTVDDDDGRIVGGHQPQEDEDEVMVDNNGQQRSNKRNIEPRIVESYSFDLDSLLLSQAWNQQVQEDEEVQIVDGPRQDVTPQWTASKVQALEHSLKNLLLKIITMEHTLPNRRRKKGVSSSSYHSPFFSDRATFRLQLHTADTHRLEQRNITWNDCKEFQYAVKHGIWYQPEEDNAHSENRNSTIGSATTTNRSSNTHKNANKSLATAAIKSLSVPECHLRMQLIVELLT